MDATMLTAVVSALAGGAAGEAGKSAWASLAALVRRRFGAGSVAALTLEPADPGKAGEVAGTLLDLAGADPEFEAELRGWTAEATRTIQQKRDVSNAISGEARIAGPVIQAGDIHGSINFGRS